MFTSDNNKNIQTACVYLIISIALAAAGAVYEHFSFGVYSYFMIYAFAIPLIGGALPFMLKYMYSGNRANAAPLAIKTSSNNTSTSGKNSGLLLYHMALATLTVGSIIKGVLDIYGTTNRLIIVYPATGVVLIILAALLLLRDKRTGRPQRDTIIYTAEPENTVG